MTAVEHIPDVTATPAWQALLTHHAQIENVQLREVESRQFAIINVA